MFRLWLLAIAKSFRRAQPARPLDLSYTARILTVSRKHHWFVEVGTGRTGAGIILVDSFSPSPKGRREIEGHAFRSSRRWRRRGRARRAEPARRDFRVLNPRGCVGERVRVWVARRDQTDLRRHRARRAEEAGPEAAHPAHAECLSGDRPQTRGSILVRTSRRAHRPAPRPASNIETCWNS